MKNQTTYEVNVTPKGFSGLQPVYEVSIYTYRTAGVCGPGIEGVVKGMDAVDEWLKENNYVRTSDFGPVCTNGFASADVDYVETREDVFGMMGRIFSPPASAKA